jgi:hypothetical protein
MIWLEGIVIMGGMVVIAVVGSQIVGRYLPPTWRRDNQHSAELVWAVTGGTFGLLLGFMVVTLWQNLEAGDRTVQDEANSLTNLYMLAGGFPASQQTRIRSLLRAYSRDVIDHEWDLLAQRQTSAEAERVVTDLWQAYLGLVTLSDARESDLYAESLHRMSEFQEARLTRISQAEGHVPSVLWVVLIIGVGVVIALMWITGSGKTHTRIPMTVALALSFGAVIFLIRVFNNPYIGDVRVGPEAIERALARWDLIDRR